MRRSLSRLASAAAQAASCQVQPAAGTTLSALAPQSCCRLNQAVSSSNVLFNRFSSAATDPVAGGEKRKACCACMDNSAAPQVFRWWSCHRGQGVYQSSYRMFANAGREEEATLRWPLPPEVLAAHPELAQAAMADAELACSQQGGRGDAESSTAGQLHHREPAAGDRAYLKLIMLFLFRCDSSAVGSCDPPHVTAAAHSPASVEACRCRLGVSSGRHSQAAAVKAPAGACRAASARAP